MPRAMRESATANGMTPPAAIRPTGDEISKALLVMAPATPSSMSVAVASRKAEGAKLAVADEGQNFPYCRVFGRQRLHLFQPFGKNAGAVKQLFIERPERGQPVAGELAALHADDVEPFEAGILSIDEPERNHVAANTANAANHHLRTDPGELMHRRKAADINEVSDLAMAAQSCRCSEDDIVADHAIMADVAVVHEIAASSDSREAATLFGSNIHRHAFAKAASLPDLQPGRLTAIAQILRRSAKRDKWMDDATGTDGRVPGHAYMRHQLAVRADHDMRANDAIRTDRRARADHCAILDPRGGVDRAHRMIRYRPVSFGVNVSGFQLVSAAQQDCPVTSDYPS